jgi:hypothetical protein
MSAPDTNTEKLEKRHRPSLLGIRGAMIFGALMLVILIGFTLTNADDPAAVSDTGADNSVTTTVPTDTYAPGTNSSDTPVDPQSTPAPVE